MKPEQSENFVLQGLDRVSRVMQRSLSVAEMTESVLRECLDIFGCERAFLLYPCAPEGKVFSIPMEVTVPEHPGAFQLGMELEMTEPQRQMMLRLLADPEPLVLGGEMLVRAQRESPVMSGQPDFHPALSATITAIQPRVGKAWAFGLHQCSYERQWTETELRLFRQIASRMADALNILTLYESLQTSEKNYRFVVDHVNESIFRLDGHLHLKFHNRPAKDFFGIAEGGVFTDIVHADDRQTVEERLHGLLARAPEEDAFDCRIAGDGNDFWGELRLRAFFQEGKEAAIVGTLIDIDARKQESLREERHRQHLEREVKRRTAELSAANEELQHSLRTLQETQAMLVQQARASTVGELMQNIAHQWRQPLNGLGVIVQDLEDCMRHGSLDEDYMGQAVAQAMNTLEGLSATIDRFGAFFSQDRERHFFFVGDVVRDAVAILQGSLASRRIEVVWQESGRPEVFGYRNDYAQAIAHIVNNAIDAFDRTQPAEKCIHIDIGQDASQRSVVTIRDSAGGIDPVLLERIFDPYVTSKFKKQGTGLGLYMTRLVIEKHMDGSITVDNVGGGARFTVRV